MKRRLLFPLILSLALAAPAAAQSDCGPFLRCGRVPWQLPVMPVLVSPTPFATSAAPYATPVPTDQSAFILPTPIYCATTPPVQGTDYKQIVVNTGPSAYWPLDETTGSVATDATGGGRHGTYTGVTLDAYALADGPAPQFDGVNDRVFITGLNSVMNSGQFTVALWMRVATSWAGSGMLAYFGDGQVFSLARSGGSIVLTSGTGTASAAASSNGTNWVHVTAVISRALMGGQSARLYINGANVANSNAAPGTFSSADTLFLGTNGIGSYYAGGIGQVAIWNRALSAGEITTLANASPAGVMTPTPDPSCIAQATPAAAIDVSQIIDTLAVLENVPGNQVGIANPQAGVDLYSGTATFFSYVLGLQNVNLGILTPILTFTFWSFFTFVGIKLAFIFLPILAALVGVVRRIIQLVLDFLPF